MWYKFDVQKFGEQMLPPLLRGGVMRALLSALLLPLRGLMDRFRVYRSESLARLRASGHTSSLRRVLNKHYALEWEILVEDIPLDPDTLYYGREGQAPIHVHRDRGTALLYDGEGRKGHAFRVRVPHFLAEHEAEIRQLIEYYRPAGQSYTLEYYEYNG